LISGLILYPVFLAAVPKIRQFFNLELPQSSFLNGAFWQLLLIQTAVGCALGILSSLIATRRHLKV
ncbi:MAG: hypothetical protein M1275_04170, partial [Patescibacteria group bacterium]|nr:hypothetical protein [Patescibacteria group bacterium]